MSNKSENDQTDEQFDEGVGKQFRALLSNGNIEEAVALQSRKKIPDQIINNHAQEAFVVLQETEQFVVALQIANKYSFSEDEINSVKIAEWNWLNNNEKFVEAAEWALSQGMSDKEIYQSGLSAFEKYLDEGNVEEALEIVQKYKLRKESLINMALVVFNKIMSEDDYYNAAR